MAEKKSALQYTGGRVSFTRTVQPAPYESKSATVDLSFVPEPGMAEEALKEAGKLAQARALDMVGLEMTDDE